MTIAKRCEVVLAFNLAERAANHDQFVAMHRAAVTRGMGDAKSASA